MFAPLTSPDRLREIHGILNNPAVAATELVNRRIPAWSVILNELNEPRPITFFPLPIRKHPCQSIAFERLQLCLESIAVKLTCVVTTRKPLFLLP